MTDQNKMPDGIWVDTETVEIEGGGKRHLMDMYLYERGTSYTRTDLYTAACAERDALRALCEGMAKYLSGMVEAADDCRIDSPHLFNPHTGQETHKWHEEWAHEAKKMLTAYEKHKAGE